MTQVLDRLRPTSDPAPTKASAAVGPSVLGWGGTRFQDSWLRIGAVLLTGSATLVAPLRSRVRSAMAWSGWVPTAS